MRKNILTLILCLGVAMAFGQLKITEIMYNPPESGTDSLEYIELYNPLSAALDLEGYIISDNNADTLPSAIVEPNGYIVVVVNKAAFQSVFNMDDAFVVEAPSLALSNGGETIWIQNPDGNYIDSVSYEKTEPWPTYDDGTSGAGASIELCDLTADNSEAAYWAAATNETGISINDKAIKGTPASANTAPCSEVTADYTVEVSSNVFTPSSLTIQVGETVKWENVEGTHNVNGSLDDYPDNPEGFYSGPASDDDWVFVYKFTQPGTYEYKCDPHASIGMVGEIIVEEEVISVPEIPIASANDTDSEGVAINLGDTVQVIGVVHGENLNPNGHQYALVDVDAQEGIGVYSNESLGYNYAEGDQIEVIGVVTQYNGLTQIEPFSIAFLSSDNDLMQPLAVDELDESTESVLVQLSNVSFDNPDDWKGDGTSFNISVTDEDGNSFLLRIDRDSEFATQEFYGQGVNITGIGSQYDNEAPYLDGYQLFPTSIAPGAKVADYALIGNINMGPNPATEFVSIDTELNIDIFTIMDDMGRVVKQGVFENNINVSDLSTGIYIISFYQADKFQSKKLMIK